MHQIGETVFRHNVLRDQSTTTDSDAVFMQLLNIICKLAQSCYTKNYIWIQCYEFSEHFVVFCLGHPV